MTTQVPTSRFVDMALSFAGGDGGNLDSEVWFCGFEWGNSHGIDIEKTIDTEFQPIPEPTSWAHEDFEGSWNTNYNRKICLFLKYFYAIDWEGMSYDEFVANHQILYPDGLGFKLNLLPVRFRNRESLAWAKAIEAASGFETFDDYRSWCVTHRGAFFRALLSKHKPKVLVCTGVGERENFLRAFADGGPRQTVQLADFSLTVAKFADTLICVTPFFGSPAGINSYQKMEQLVSKIKLLLAA